MNIIKAGLEHDTPQVNAAIIVMTELMRIESIEKHSPNLVRVPYVVDTLAEEIQRMPKSGALDKRSRQAEKSQYSSIEK
jgi:hypothetical protein